MLPVTVRVTQSEIVMATPDARSELVVAQLTGLRAQRREAQANAEQLADRIRTVVAEAQSVGIPMAQVARLLDIDRSTLYRVYASI